MCNKTNRAICQRSWHSSFTIYKFSRGERWKQAFEIFAGFPEK